MARTASSTITVSYGHALLRAATAAGVQVDSAALPTSGQRLTFPQLRTLWEKVLRQAGDPHFGLHMGTRLQPSALHVLGYALLSCASLEEAARLAVRYHPLVSEAGLLTLERDERQAALVYTPRDPSEDMDPQQVEAVLAGTVAAVRWLAGESWTPTAVHLAHRCRGNHDEYIRIFRSPVHFDAAHHAVSFDPRCLAQPLPLSDPVLAALHRDHAERLLRALPNAGSFLARAEDHVRYRLGAGPGPAELARALHVSPRSLRRALQQDGTSWRQLNDLVRHDRACELLRSSDRTVGQVAREVGLSDATSLVRAFKRWEGMTPGAYRALNRSTAQSAGRGSGDTGAR